MVVPHPPPPLPTTPFHHHLFPPSHYTLPNLSTPESDEMFHKYYYMTTITTPSGIANPLLPLNYRKPSVQRAQLKTGSESDETIIMGD